MENALKAIGHALSQFALELWRNRLRVFIYVFCIIAASHVLIQFAENVAAVPFVPEAWRFIMPLALAIGSGIMAAEFLICIASNIYKRIFLWRNLSDEEILFIIPYINEDTRTRYIVAYNGTWRDSGTVELLMRKNIIYLASQYSEYRGESYISADQTFPFNMHNDAFSFFKKNKPVLKKVDKVANLPRRRDASRR